MHDENIVNGRRVSSENFLVTVEALKEPLLQESGEICRAMRTIALEMILGVRSLNSKQKRNPNT